MGPHSDVAMAYGCDQNMGLTGKWTAKATIWSVFATNRSELIVLLYQSWGRIDCLAVRPGH